MIKCSECSHITPKFKHFSKINVRSVNTENISGNSVNAVQKIKTNLTLSVPIPDKEKKLSWIFIFTFLCHASKGFWGITKKGKNKNLT